MLVDRPTATATRQVGPRAARTVGLLTAHGLRSFARTPVSAFFTLGFPLLFLVIVSAIVGNEMTDAGVPVAQFLVAPFAVFGVAQAVFVVLATDTARLREDGILRRLRGTPVPSWTVLAGRIAAAVVVATLAVAVLTVVGVGAYGVDVVWRKLPALLVTLVLGIACLAALGLALVSLTRTVLAAQTLSQGLLIPLAFISDVFIVNAQLPRPLAVLGDVLPLKHFARAMAETFDPHGGLGFSPGHLAVLALWAVAGVVVARWRFGWAPRGGSTGRRAAAVESAPGGGRLGEPTVGRRPSPVALLTNQLGYALTALRRDALSVFFAVVFPVLLLVLFPTVFGDTEVRGLTLPQYLLPGLTAYAIAVSGYVNMPEQVAQARDQGVLKRLAGAPLPFGAYLAGRVASVLVVSALAAMLLVIAAVAFLDVRLDPARVPAIVLALLLGVLCFSALGLAVASLVRSAQALTPITLGTLLPLSFISDVFLVGPAPLPGWLSFIADLFPLKHLARALLAATGPDGAPPGLAWTHLAVIAAWTVAGLLVARRWTR